MARRLAGGDSTAIPRVNDGHLLGCSPVHTQMATSQSKHKAYLPKQGPRHAWSKPRRDENGAHGLSAVADLRSRETTWTTMASRWRRIRPPNGWRDTAGRRCPRERARTAGNKYASARGNAANARPRGSDGKACCRRNWQCRGAGSSSVSTDRSARGATSRRRSASTGDRPEATAAAALFQVLVLLHAHGLPHNAGHVRRVQGVELAHGNP